MGALLVGIAISGGMATTPEAHADPLGVVAGEVLDVSAKRLDVDVEGGTAKLQGEVHATLGELDVECDKVEIRYDPSPRVQWARGTGSVKARVRGIEATADTVEVRVPERTVELRGGVRLARGRGWVTAARATINIATQKVSLEGVKGSIPVEAPAR